MNQSRFIGGLLLTALLAATAQMMSRLPLLSIFGVMVTAILLGLTLRAISESVVTPLSPGISFSAKYVLRAGIILMGVRLNIGDIVAAGWKTIVLDVLVILFAISVIHYLGRKMALASKLTSLIAAGTGVCGAAAIGAVGPVIKAKDEEVALSVAIIALLGTLFTVIYTALLPILNWSPHEYGLFAGSTLHEIAHVVAASAPGGPVSSDTALLVKLGRVVLLAPVVMFMDWLYNKRTQNSSLANPGKRVIPWFVFGFLGMALLNTYHVFSADMAQKIISTSVFLLAMAMAGMGLNVHIGDIRRVGLKPMVVGITGSVLLSLFGRGLIVLLGL
ncbi:YeiH family putative sulfate export transporter [Heliobacterium chlorum]|uniref:YeiH family putative sulfate export transporter n=1 Tax=Heliobacterium chlorum TaxID=2698 RepID=A0ABR7T2J6_HELCL|nr:YeiH family protein [Heliobacterium chlorum]MBC9784560.1 YeiH family putative sulfate export transporter [Heliobacterium chlorum]